MSRESEGASTLSSAYEANALNTPLARIVGHDQLIAGHREDGKKGAVKISSEASIHGCFRPN
jgi:hypothetical protein